VIAGDQELELRRILEEVLAHKSRADLVAAGQCLDLGLGPAPTFLGFHRSDEAGAAQSGNKETIADNSALLAQS